MRVIAVDTETVSDAPWSIQSASDENPAGMMHYCDEYNHMTAIRTRLEWAETLTVAHNAKFDLGILEQCDIHPYHTECTMQMAYLLGMPALSLKVLAYRIAGIEMRTFDEVTRGATQEKAEAYLWDVVMREWPDPDPTMRVAKDGEVKFSFPKNIRGKVERLLANYAGDPTIDLRKKWLAMDEGGGRGQVEEVMGRMGRAYLDEVDREEAEEYAKLDAVATLAIYPYLHQQIEYYGLQGVLERDMDCIPMVMEMEDNGILLDTEVLEELRIDLDRLTEDAQVDINYLAGQYVNPRSSQQVIALLQDMGIYTDIETSTDASVLDQYRQHTIVNKIQNYRAYTKLQSTYVEGLLKVAGVDGRIHTTYSVTRTETGRLASCLPEYTRITTVQGAIPLGDVEVGDRVWTRQSGWCNVLNKFDNGLQDVFRVTLSSGHCIDCTSTHRLMANFGWYSLEDIYEYVQKTFIEPGALKADCEGISWGGQAHYCGDCGVLWGELPHGHGDTHARFTRGGIQTGESNKEVAEQVDGEEPDVGAIPGTTSQLQGGDLRRARLHGNTPACVVYRGKAEQARTTPPSSLVRGSGDDGSAEGLCSSSHQWRQDRQQAGESCITIAWGAHGDSPQYSPIYSVQYVGVLRVHDLEVETDHCFIANGIFVHNSKPNLQNIPVRTELGRRIRQAFISERSE